jgi:signal transduction histidine kinase
MLELSRPKVPAIEPLDLAATAREVVVLAGKSGRGTDVEVRYEGLQSAVVLADPGQMRQVVWNLVRNAIQASSAGSEVVVSLRRDEATQGYAFEVRDAGQGIPSEARERLFDAFFTTRSHGMGIGLAVVKRILDDHGFEVEVDSHEGEGTAFRVRVPGRASRAELAEPLPVSERLPRSRSIG